MERSPAYVPVADSDGKRYGTPILMKPRLGQGAFRVLVTDAYERRCAVSGEKTLPILDAAHIGPILMVVIMKARQRPSASHRHP